MERHLSRTLRKNFFFKMVREPICGSFLIFCSAAIYLFLCLALFLHWNALDYSFSALFVSIFLAASGTLESVFSWQNRRVFESWGLFMQGSFLPLAAALTLLVADASVTERLLVAYLAISGAFNIVVAMTLSQYGMVDWKGFAFLNSAIFFGSASYLFISELPILLPSMLAAAGSGRILLVIGIGKLNTFPGKVSRQVYAKIEAAREEYAAALEKNWDADEKLYM